MARNVPGIIRRIEESQSFWQSIPSHGENNNGIGIHKGISKE